MQRTELQRYLHELLEVARFKDYCPNGLQVEGRDEVQRVVCGVTASQALLDAAVAQEADAILVHHGYFWRGEDGCVTGLRRRRLATLLKHDINLLAFHLPLDAHPELGNNAQLAALMGWAAESRFGEQDLGWLGRLATPVSLAELVQAVGARLQRAPLAVGDPDKIIRRIAWCSGGAQGFFEQAIAEGVDCYVSGEASEPTFHLANESGVSYLGIGHHASERYGIKALGEHLAARFGLDVVFVDLPNPI